jgi:hypothetical protein
MNCKAKDAEVICIAEEAREAKEAQKAEAAAEEVRATNKRPRRFGRPMRP